MGYDTDFTGSFDIDRPLDKETQKILKGLNYTRRVKRNPIKLAEELDITPIECIKLYGEECEFYFNFDNEFGQTETGDIINFNTPPDCQPSLWCKWHYNEKDNTIEWDGAEKFYEYIEWIEYMIKNILELRDYKLNGSVTWEGEEGDDLGEISIRNNKVTVKHGYTVYE